ncbi:50S ribosomal protein L18 [Patescibacteria group bacterium]|nr:50S ribosomal protein L18 [Patescibacteria group bacterium]
MDKKINRQLRKNRVRAKVSGTGKVPRLTVSSSLSHIRAQIIDDQKGITLCAADDLKMDKKITKTEKAKLVGAEIAKEAKAKKIDKVVFDRGHRLYHGRIKALAESARESGLKF